MDGSEDSKSENSENSGSSFDEETVWSVEASEQEEGVTKFKEPMYLSPLAANIAVIIVDEFVNKLEMCAASVPKCENPVAFKDLKQRFAKILEENLKQESNFSDIIEAEETRWTQKFYKQRSIIIKVLRMLSDELRNFNTVETIKEYITITLKVHLQEKAITKEFTENRQELARMEEITNQGMYFDQQAEENIKWRIAKIKEEKEKLMFELGVKLSYSNKWNEARQAQNSILLRRQEGDLEKEVQALHELIKKEKKCHDDLMMFIEENLQSVIKKTEEWTERYNKKIEQMDFEILALKQRKHDDFELMKATYEEYRRREQFIIDALQAKYQRLIDECEQRFYNKMAIRIQDWWRCAFKYRKKWKKKRK